MASRAGVVVDHDAYDVSSDEQSTSRSRERAAGQNAAPACEIQTTQGFAAGGGGHVSLQRTLACQIKDQRIAPYGVIADHRMAGRASFSTTAKPHCERVLTEAVGADLERFRFGHSAAKIGVEAKAEGLTHSPWLC